ncbi:MAG: Rieske 2Fe-2S domain-containing protein [Pirellulales bacterium]|nr:Rieske 2Fe-2S domain-containing protein [Pirellulales bacterium]
MENQPSSSSCCGGSAASKPNEPRRGFLAKMAAVVLGLVAIAVPGAVGLITALNPFRQKGAGGQFFRVTTLDVLPEDGTPQRFPIISDRRDAWTLFPDEPIGFVYLRRVKPDEVKALNVICPHAGCFIGYDAKANGFLCPCHVAHFDLDGRRTDEHSHSPRDMDTLDDVEIRNGNEVWVRFENFKNGTADKIAEV